MVVVAVVVVAPVVVVPVEVVVVPVEVVVVAVVAVVVVLAAVVVAAVVSVVVAAAVGVAGVVSVVEAVVSVVETGVVSVEVVVPLPVSPSAPAASRPTANSPARPSSSFAVVRRAERRLPAFPSRRIDAYSLSSTTSARATESNRPSGLSQLQLVEGAGRPSRTGSRKRCVGAGLRSEITLWGDAVFTTPDMIERETYVALRP